MNKPPLHDRDGDIWLDGKFVPWRDANIHILSHALHYGSAVFEGNRAYNGKVFALDSHTERLINSAQLMGFNIPFSKKQINEACKQTLAKSGLQNAYMRPIAWRGSEQMGVSARTNKIHLAIAVWEWASYFTQKEQGIRLCMAQWRRPDPRTIPCKAKGAGLYMICTLSKHTAEDKNFDDALMLDFKGRIAECTGAHIFFIKEGALHTPTNDILLDGITHRTVSELAKKRNIPVYKRDIMPEELPSFEACFIVGTAAEITPVRMIEDHVFTPENITKTLTNDYDALVKHGKNKA